MANEQIVNQPFLYINGLLISNDATTPNTKVDVAAGICRDSTNVYDMNLGNYLNANPSLANANVATVINAAANGVNGLDTGSLAASTFYNIFVIADPTGFLPTAAILSVNAVATGPVMPFGYGIFRHIGTILTDGSSHFLLTYYTAGVTGSRYAQYDAPITVTVTASGTSATYSAMDLSVAVPLVSFRRAAVQMKYTCNAAADSVKFQPTGATGDYITYLGQVASVALEESFLILPLIATAKPEISYKVSAGTLNTVQVQGYEFSV
jgi:hypothetical protein